jgi:hypothetical protein
MLPTEVEQKSFQLQQCFEEQSNDSRVDDLTKLEKMHEAVVIQSVKHQQMMRRYHACNISSHNFKVGDLVLQIIQMTKDQHKLSPIWEGPFEVVEVTRSDSYRLQWEDDLEVPNF